MTDKIAPPVSRPFPASEALLLAAFACLLCALLIQGFYGYGRRVSQFDDTVHYARVTRALRTGDLAQLSGVKLFWGLPYAAAALAALTPLSDTAAIIAVSVLSSLAAVFLVARLWGTVVAAWFALSTDWIQRAILGGSESLLLLLVAAAFCLARRGRWNLAALASAAAATVRPPGLFAFFGVLLAVTLRRDYRRLPALAAIGLLVAALYSLPLLAAYGRPLANVEGYREDWASGSPLTLPLLPLLRGLQASREPVSNTLKIAFWLALVLAGVALAAASGRFRRYCAENPAEAAFAVLYLFFLLSYNSTRWAWSQFPRFALPILPFVLLAFERWLPARRSVLWGLAVLSAAFAAASAIGVQNFWLQLRHVLTG